MDATAKAIWIDLDNSPHVPLFAPIIDHYRQRGVEVVLTARDHAQTVELMSLAGFDGTFSVIGRHYGKGKVNKIFGLATRALRLGSHIRRLPGGSKRIGVAVSHGSRSMVLAARRMHIPVITMYDYEFTETRIFNRFSDRVLVPGSIPDGTLDEIGLAESKRVKYAGIKEELYTRSFQPAEGFRQRFLNDCGRPVADDDIFIVLRPPATTANYHAPESEALLEAILQHIAGANGTFTVIVPRTDDQARELRSWLAANAPAAGDRYLILESSVKGLDLSYASDLLISGGGTMNREAALLGVPVYSIFAGRQGALDAQMEKDGLITFIRSHEDVSKIRLTKRTHPGSGYTSGLTDRVERFVIEQINPFLEKG